MFNFFSDLSIKTKLIIGFGSVLLINIFLLLGNISIMNALSGQAARMVEINIPTQKAGELLETGIQTSQMALLELMLDGREVNQQHRRFAWRRDIKSSIESLDKLSVYWPNKDNQIRLQQIKKLLGRLEQYQDEIEQFYENPSLRHQVKHRWREKAVPTARRLVAVLKDMLVSQNYQLEYDAKRIAQLIKDRVHYELFLLVFSGLFAVIMAILIISSISNSISELISTARRLAQKGSRPEVHNHKGNELSRVGHAMELMALALYDASNAEKIALQKVADTADAANREKSHFLTNMSHELRTPMHGILSYAQLGVERVDRLSTEKLRYYFKNINDSGQRLLILLNDLLELSKLEAGKMELHTESHNIEQMIACCYNEMAAKMDERNLNIIIDKPKFPVLVNCDKSRITQVLINLLSNAIKFSPAGGDIIFRYMIREQEQLELRVIDQGCGIDPSRREKIFDKFVQDERIDAGTGMGSTGLGLAICKEIIMLHQGKIWAEHSNQEDIGGIVCFTLPL